MHEDELDIRLTQSLDDLDDVQSVHANFEVDDRLLEQIAG